MIPSPGAGKTQLMSVYQRGLVIDSQRMGFAWIVMGSISKGIGD